MDTLEIKFSLLVLALPHTSLGQAQKGDGNVHAGRPTSAYARYWQYLDHETSTF